jgi:hypothetical protein
MSTWSNQPMSTPGPPPVGAPAPMPGGAYGPPPQPPRSGPNPALIVGLVLLLVGAVAGLGIFLVSSDDDGDDTENASNRRERSGQEDAPCSQQELRSQDGGGSQAGNAVDGCAVPEATDVPVEVPELPEVPDAPSAPSSSDVLTALAENVYENTPASIDEDTAICMADIILSVVGEDAVVAADADYQTIYSSSTPSQDAAISSGVYTCTTAEQDADLHADPNWPGAWGPGTSDAPSQPSTSDVLGALAENVYENTPASIDEDTAICMAEVILSVVGESTVVAAGADFQTIYSGTSAAEDAAISSGVYTCTTTEQDADLHADPNWPGPWGPA